MRMTIFNKYATLQAALGYFCITSAIWIFCTIDSPVLLLLVFFIISFIMITMFWIGSGRRIVLSCDGLEISFMWIKKKYPWKYVPIRQFFDGMNRLGYRTHYACGIILSYKKIRFPRWMHPMQYCVMFHPFSCVVLNFPNSKPIPKYYPSMYEVDKEYLLQLFDEFKVELSERQGNDPKPLKK